MNTPISSQHILRYRILHHLIHASLPRLETDILNAKNLISFSRQNIRDEIDYLKKQEYISCDANRYTITQAGVQYAEELEAYEPDKYEERMKICILHFLVYTDSAIYEDICDRAKYDHFDQHTATVVLAELKSQNLVSNEESCWSLTEKGAIYLRRALDASQ